MQIIKKEQLTSESEESVCGEGAGEEEDEAFEEEEQDGENDKNEAVEERELKFVCEPCGVGFAGKKNMRERERERELILKYVVKV